MKIVKVESLFILIIMMLISHTIFAQNNKLKPQDSVLLSTIEADTIMINILNETAYVVFIYIDNELALTVEKHNQKTNYPVYKVKSIYARTYNDKYRWGPIDLSERKKDLFWKLTKNE